MGPAAGLRRGGMPLNSSLFRTLSKGESWCARPSCGLCSGVAHGKPTTWTERLYRPNSDTLGVDGPALLDLELEAAWAVVGWPASGRL